MTTTLDRLRGKQGRLAQLRSIDGKRWWHHPVTFVDDVITFPDGGQLASYQATELSDLGEHRKVAVRAPRGSGKTMPAALAFWWFACTRELAAQDWKILTTAGSWPQLAKYLWPEIRKWSNRMDWERIGLPKPRIGHELLTNELKWAHGEGFARAAKDPDLIEGAHATNMLVIIDEGKSVEDAIWDSIEGYFANPGNHYVLALSVPGAPVGRFADIHHRKKGFDDWHPIHVTLDEAVREGRVTREWADARLAQWGHDSVMYQCHVLAEFGGSEDGVIPLAWIEAAVERGKDSTAELRPHRIGVDVADTGDDQTVFAYINEDGVYRLERVTEGDVVDHANKLTSRTVKGTRIVVDSIGVGAGTLAQAKKLGLDAVGFVASERTTRLDRTGEFGFINKRAAAWWNLRELLDPELGDGICLPDDAELLGDLSAPKWMEAAGGRIQVESKADIRKRLGRSTDVGDACVQGMWRDVGRVGGWGDNAGAV